ncbi:MAG: hypothetical protein JSR27_09185 [Proteobacteria bacterium]|nr:hypothetical protein [Pseudomonadota bacterium]
MKSDAGGGGLGTSAQLTMPLGKMELKVKELAVLAASMGCGASQSNGWLKATTTVSPASGADGAKVMDCAAADPAKSSNVQKTPGLK